MDIRIEAPGHDSQDQLQSYYADRIEAKYGHYTFIQAIDVKVSQNKDLTKVSLQMKPEKGSLLYVEDQDPIENKALNEAIRKMNLQVEKYKAKHYHNVHTINKNTRLMN